MECQNKKCSRTATASNLEYFKDIWYCTLHANKATKEARRIKKYANRINKYNREHDNKLTGEYTFKTKIK